MAIMTRQEVIDFVPQVLSPDIILKIMEKTKLLNSKAVMTIVEEGLKRGKIDIAYAGDLPPFALKVEGEDMMEAEFTVDKISIDMEIYAQAVKRTLEADFSFNGDMGAITIAQLSKMYATSIDKLLFDLMASTTTPEIDKSSVIINADDISSTLAALEVEDPASYTLYISFEQLHQLRIAKDANDNPIWTDALATNILTTGQVGSVYGVPVVPNGNIKDDGGETVSFLIEDEALAFVKPDNADSLLSLTSDVNNKALTFTINSHAILGRGFVPYKKIQPIRFKTV